MSEREEWMNLIRNEYDPKPDLGRASYPAFDSEWDDGAGRIADAILADKLLAVKAERERCARIARDGCLVPPDGGSPTEAEADMCRDIANAILGTPAFPRPNGDRP
jgi:hypothetical protein